MLENINHIYSLFADILEYPTLILLDRVKKAVTLLSQVDQEAVTKMDRFRSFVEQTPLGRLEEIYTGTFDLQIVCYPYAGYHLFGESYKRGEFLARLKERYSANGFSAGKELPDHVSVILRFLDNLQDEGEGMVLISECLIPTLKKMVGDLERSGNPYGDVVQALLLTLQASHPEEVNEGSLRPGRDEV